MSTEKVSLGEVVETTSSETGSQVSGYDQKESKRLLRKIDWHLIPFLSLLYL